MAKENECQCNDTNYPNHVRYIFSCQELTKGLLVLLIRLFQHNKTLQRVTQNHDDQTYWEMTIYSNDPKMLILTIHLNGIIFQNFLKTSIL